VRLRITVNDQVVLNNFKEGNPVEQDNQQALSQEDKDKLL